jgi:hypothetical protein
MNEILCPNCPVCGQPPTLALAGMSQWFCGTDGCVVLCWEPYSTLEANLLHASPATVTETREEDS